MGVFANIPVALAPGMGLNAFFTYGITLGMGFTWETALGAVFWSGIIFFSISILGIREKIISSIPESLKIGIVIGIGLFLAIIGLDNASIIESGEATISQLTNIAHNKPALFSIAGLIVISVLHSYKKNWAVLFGVFFVSILGWIFDSGESFNINNIIDIPPTISPTFLN